MITVNDLLTLPALQGVKALAGRRGLKRQVNYVTVMEVPDIKRWLKGNDFLITSFYSVRKSEDAQCDLIEELQDTCACIAVKTGQYVNTLSPRVLETADRCEIPLLEIPFTTTYIDMLMSIMNQILVDEGREEILRRYLEDIIYENYSDPQIMLERGRLLGMEVRRNLFAFIRLDFRSKTLRQKQGLSLWGAELEGYLRNSGKILRCYRVRWGQSVLLLAESKPCVELGLALREMLGERCLAAAGGFDKQAMSISVGPAGMGLAGLYRSYDHMARAFQTGCLLYSDSLVYFYDALKPFCRLREIMTLEEGKAFTDLLAALDTPEMFDTLAMYFAFDGDLDGMAGKMHLHKNTVKYRLGRLQEKAGLRLNRPRESFLLYLAVLARHFQENEVIAWDCPPSEM